MEQLIPTTKLSLNKQTIIKLNNLHLKSTRGRQRESHSYPTIGSDSCE